MRILPNEDDTAANSLAPAADWRQMRSTDHFVQFYESDEFLVQSVSGFVAAGLRGGEGVIVIATPEHQQGISQKLHEDGLDVATLLACGQYIALDAAKTLESFMVNGTPNDDLFFELIGTVFKRASQSGRPVRAFGEMVALLWEAGNQEAAIRLEELWNNFGKITPFSLFCAYPLAACKGEKNGKPFLHLCNEHSRVIPSESYTTRPEAEQRLRLISQLQQRASSLETEISERKLTQAALHNQQARLTLALAAAQLGVWELDVAAKSLECSDQCKAHFGVPASESLTFPAFLALIDPADRPAVETSFVEAKETRGEFRAIYRVRRNGQPLRWISSIGRFVEEGSLRLVGITQDITERKAASEVLEQAVADRTAALRETIAELEAFSYSISHDLRAPLRSIQSFAELVLHESGALLPPASRGYLQRISSAGERMDRLIQDVLNISRTGRQELPIENVDLDGLVRGILGTYPNFQSPQADVFIEGRLPAVIGNPAALTQCISNLLENAIKFVAPGIHPEVRIRAEMAADSASLGSKPRVDGPTPPYVRLCIEDNGIGLPENADQKIFGIFQRLDHSYEGTGIGLAIVRKAIERMCGKVGAEPSPRGGSIFWLGLPLADRPKQ